MKLYGDRDGAELQVQENEENRLTRGKLLASAGAIGAGLLTAGPRQLLSPALGARQAGVGGTIDFFSWQGYDIPIPAMKAWLKQNGITLHSSYVSNHQEIQAKFTIGGGKGLYNLSTYDAGYGQDYQKLGITTPLDMSKIPNFKSVYSIFRSGTPWETFWHFKGQTWGIPWTWGIEGINYVSGKVPTPTSYLQLLQPQFKGRVGIVDDPAAAVWIAAHSLNMFNLPSKYTASDLKKFMAWWKPFKAQARSIAPSYGDVADQFVAGEIDVAVPGWAAVNSFAAGKGMKTVKTTLPKEGGASFCDSWFIPPDAKDTDSAYAWINYTLTPGMQAKAQAYEVAGTVTPAAVPLMDAATRSLYPYGNVKKLFAAAPLPGIPVLSPGPKYTRLSDWQDAWEAFKAS
jgi:spermidine/putrescine-binding protein